jgi:hypothetical protein
VNPNSHSLKKIEKEGILYFYTCPSKATLYYDTKSILNHYKGVLSEINKEWIWVFDGTGFTLEHALQVQVAIELAKLLSSFPTLKKIIIINPTLYIRIPYQIVMPFLNQTLRDSIVMDPDFNIGNEYGKGE